MAHQRVRVLDRVVGREKSTMAALTSLGAGMAACVLAVSLLAAKAIANGPNVGRDAGMVFPVRNDVVQLVSERVVIKLAPYASPYARLGEAVCTYELRNLSDTPQTFEMAFFTNRPFAATDRSEYRRHYMTAGFSVTEGARSLAVAYEPVDVSGWSPLYEGLPDSLPVWQVTIGPDTSTVLNMEYSVEWSGGADGESNSRYFQYHARPAALWAGTIDSAEIAFEIDDETVRTIADHRGSDPCFEEIVTPEGGNWDGNRIVWRFGDWEPENDLYLGYRFCDPWRTRSNRVPRER